MTEDRREGLTAVRIPEGGVQILEGAPQEGCGPLRPKRDAVLEQAFPEGRHLAEQRFEVRGPPFGGIAVVKVPQGQFGGDGDDGALRPVGTGGVPAQLLQVGGQLLSAREDDPASLEVVAFEVYLGEQEDHPLARLQDGPHQLDVRGLEGAAYGGDVQDDVQGREDTAQHEFGVPGQLAGVEAGRIDEDQPLGEGGARAGPFDAGDPALVAGVHPLRRELLELTGGQGVPGETFVPAVLVADVDGPEAALAAEDRYVGRGPGLLGEQAFAHHRVDQGGLAAARDPDDADGQLGAAGRPQQGLELRRAGREPGGDRAQGQGGEGRLQKRRQLRLYGLRRRHVLCGRFRGPEERIGYRELFLEGGTEGAALEATAQPQVFLLRLGLVRDVDQNGQFSLRVGQGGQGGPKRPCAAPGVLDVEQISLPRRPDPIGKGGISGAEGLHGVAERGDGPLGARAEGKRKRTEQGAEGREAGAGVRQFGLRRREKAGRSRVLGPPLLELPLQFLAEGPPCRGPAVRDPLGGQVRLGPQQLERGPIVRAKDAGVEPEGTVDPVAAVKAPRKGQRRPVRLVERPQHALCLRVVLGVSQLVPLVEVLRPGAGRETQERQEAIREGNLPGREADLEGRLVRETHEVVPEGGRVCGHRGGRRSEMDKGRTGCSRPPGVWKRGVEMFVLRAAVFRSDMEPSSF